MCTSRVDKGRGDGNTCSSKNKLPASVDEVAVDEFEKTSGIDSGRRASACRVHDSHHSGRPSSRCKTTNALPSDFVSHRRSLTLKESTFKYANDGLVVFSSRTEYIAQVLQPAANNPDNVID